MKIKTFIKKASVLFIALAIFVPISVFSVSAKEGQAVDIYIDGNKYSGRSILRNSTTYVAIRDFSDHMGAESIEWNDKTKTVSVKADEITINAENSSNYIIANGRYLWAPTGIINISGSIFVPLRPISKAFNAEVSWNSETFSAKVIKGKGHIVSGDKYYDPDDLYWLSRIISAEAGVEPFYGKIAVGTVVMNRVKSMQYPDSIYGVIFDKKFGVQFTPAANGTVYNTPDSDSITAAKLCLDGASVSDKVLFFVNEKIAENSWVQDNRDFVAAIGNHNFYA